MHGERRPERKDGVSVMARVRVHRIQRPGGAIPHGVLQRMLGQIVIDDMRVAVRIERQRRFVTDVAQFVYQFVLPAQRRRQRRGAGLRRMEACTANGALSASPTSASGTRMTRVIRKVRAFIGTLCTVYLIYSKSY